MALPPSGMVPPCCAGPAGGTRNRRTAGRGDSSLSYGHLRSSAADRESVVDVLKAAFAEGRLDQDELAERVGLAYRSRTYAELAALTDDLPAGLPGTDLSAGQLASGLPDRLIPALSPGRPPVSPRLTAAPANAPQPHSPGATPPAPAARQLSGLAIASSILGIGGFVTTGITSPFALLVGIVAMPRLARRGERGAAFVFLGIVLGLIGTLFILVPQLVMGRLLP